MPLRLYTDAELRAVTEPLEAPGASTPFGAYLFRPDEPGADLARTLETRCSSTPTTTRPRSRRTSSAVRPVQLVHLRRRPPRGVPAGAMRVIVPSPHGLEEPRRSPPVWGEPPEELFRRTGLEVDRDRAWDIATIAVPWLPQRSAQRPADHGALPDAHAGGVPLRRRVVHRHPRHAGVPPAPLEAAHDLRRLHRRRPAAVPGFGRQPPAWCDVAAASATWRPRTRTCTTSWSAAAGSSRPCGRSTWRPRTRS